MILIANLQELIPNGIIREQLLLELLGVQRVSLVDRIGQVGLRAVVEVLDLVDFVRVEDVFVADLLQEPTYNGTTVRNSRAGE